MSDPIEISELGKADLRALDGEIRIGQRICDFYIDTEWDGEVSTLDRLIDMWLMDSREQKPSANNIALGIGSLAGEFLRIAFGCRWVIVTVASGCDLGLFSDKTGFQFFPRHWIAKRLEPKMTGQSIVGGIIGALERDGKFGV